MAEAKTERLDLSVLVPVIERPDDLDELHAATARQVEKLGVTYEFIYLVSASFERSLAQALALHEADPVHVRVVRFGRRVGEAAALATGFERARGELLLTVPAFFQAEPMGIAAMHRAVRDGADVAVACRRGRREGAAKRVQSVAFNRLASWATGTRFEDLGSGTRMLRREVIDEIPLYGDFHRFLPILASRVGFAVQEVPVPQDPRARAPLFYSPATYLWRVMDLVSVFFITRFTRRPLRLFGAVGAGFGALGVGILLMALIQRMTGTPLAGRPILVLGTLLVGIGVQAVTIGLLGELLLFFHAREIRDYRIAEVLEADVPALPERAESESDS